MRRRLARIAATAAIPLLLAGFSTSAQAHDKPRCQSTGTDEAVESPIEIDRSAACPGNRSTLAIHYPHSVDGTVLFQDKPPLGGQPSEHDDVRFVIASQDPQPYVTFNGERYNLSNVHFHGHAEHKFAGQPFAPLEAHLVHERATLPKAYVVFSVLIDSANLSKPSELDRLIASPPAPGASKTLHDIDLKALLPADHSTYRYTGSLTTPDEIQNYFKPVNWVVFDHRVKAGQKNVQAYRALWDADGNRRELQVNLPAPRVYAYR
ncbi:carbonic anhydrase family protein [Streptosporangium lutulentum]|uniref:carbonic anhydrase n=1 Tax=Streptosporangium lutulentum TaxID=1461250 RepID=A0ABT9Q5T8_9ACTN|nr:carbonic anhydrase family protein [Streptosporangium lutulentum]MDP9842052.1 carbonic anhydrase [Streptosporangium lutulentum]